MKKIFLFVIAIAVTMVSISCKEDVTKKIQKENLEKAKTQNKVNNADAPVIEFATALHDFGEINEGDTVETTFKFKNTGKSELIITSIKASCGCTVPSNWSREPIMPGKEGEFTVKFDSKNKPNSRSNAITLTTNTSKGKEIVRIKAFVKPDPVQEKIRAEKKAKRKQQQEERLAKQAKEKAAATK